MYQVNIHEAKTNLSKLIKKVVSGEEVIIARGNKPLVKMVFLEGKKPKRKLGTAKGKIKIAPDFDAPMDDRPYLIDTYTLLWIVTDSPKLSDRAKTLYLNPENKIIISLASIWELAIKSSLNKLTLEKPLEEFIDEHIKGNDIQILNIELPHILRIEKLPFHHRDPFDRLIISQQIENNLPVIGSDKEFDQYGIKRIW